MDDERRDGVDEADATGRTSTAGLAEAVLDDELRYVGVPMLLHTPSTLDGAAADVTFSTETYLQQGRLARRLLATGRLEGPEADVLPAALRARPLLALNFHDVPAELRATAADRIRQVADLGPGYDPDDDAAGLRVLIGFYDGDRETGLFGADLCVRLGVRAWFFPLLAEGGPYVPTDRLTDRDLADIATAHELCFHTASHVSAPQVTGDNLHAEVVEPVQRLGRLAGRPVRTGAWMGGTRFDPSGLGDRTLCELGVRYAVSNWSVEPIP